jgi:hypothetical protein
MLLAYAPSLGAHPMRLKMRTDYAPSQCAIPMKLENTPGLCA